MRSFHDTSARIATIALVAATLAFAVTANASADAGAAASASASASGGSRYWSNSQTGGIQPGTTAPRRPASKSRKKRAAPPLITGFKLVSASLFDEGRPLKLRFRIKARARRVRVKLLVRTAAGKYVSSIKLGVRKTKSLQTVELNRRQLAIPAIGQYKIRLTAVDGKGRRAVRAAKVAPWLEFSFADHRFPIAGRFDFGGDDARFGAPRPGHSHQGQDLTAAEGTPLVAPYGGRTSFARFQAKGAGWYVVLDAGDGRDYVFMHLQAGSIEVKEGDVVPTGKLLARVGSTGASSGPHLHFEVWTGGNWQFGGRPVDPRPLLESWFAAAPGGATNSSSRLSAAAKIDRRRRRPSIATDDGRAALGDGRAALGFDGARHPPP
ncbi:MAG: M23 family metallopeptidase [Solirubrobacterales bacterium]